MGDEPLPKCSPDKTQRFGKRNLSHLKYSVRNSLDKT